HDLEGDGGDPSSGLRHHEPREPSGDAPRLERPAAGARPPAAGRDLDVRLHAYALLPGGRLPGDARCDHGPSGRRGPGGLRSGLAAARSARDSAAASAVSQASPMSAPARMSLGQWTPMRSRPRSTRQTAARARNAAVARSLALDEDLAHRKASIP